MWCRFDGNEWLCNIRCVMLNYYNLGLLQVGLKSFAISVDYRDYMGSSLETWLLVDCFYTWTLIIWSVMWHDLPKGSGNYRFGGNETQINSACEQHDSKLCNSFFFDIFLLLRSTQEVTTGNLSLNKWKTWPVKFFEDCEKYEKKL